MGKRIQTSEPSGVWSRPAKTGFENVRKRVYMINTTPICDIFYLITDISPPFVPSVPASIHPCAMLVPHDDVQCGKPTLVPGYRRTHGRKRPRKLCELTSVQQGPLPSRFGVLPMTEAAPRHSTGVLAARLSILRLTSPYESILRFSLIWPLLLLNHYLTPCQRTVRTPTSNQR